VDLPRLAVVAFGKFIRIQFVDNIIIVIDLYSD
jgi:hypothetical protein